MVQPPGGHILIVEDHAPTARIMTTVFDEVASSISTYIVPDGRECLAILRGEDDSTTPPDLVLLDLDLPVIDGITVLEQRSEEPAMRHVPTIVVSSMKDPETITECYRKGANAFIAKPDDLDAYTTVADSITEFWFSTVTLPGDQT